MSSLSVVWAAQQRFLHWVNAGSHDADNDQQLIDKLKKHLEGSETDIRKAYQLDDEVENYYVRLKTGSLPASKKKPTSGGAGEQTSGSYQDPAGGEHQPHQQQLNSTRRKFGDAKNWLLDNVFANINMGNTSPEEKASPATTEKGKKNTKKHADEQASTSEKASGDTLEKPAAIEEKMIKPANEQTSTGEHTSDDTLEKPVAIKEETEKLANEQASIDEEHAPDDILEAHAETEEEKTKPSSEKASSGEHASDDTLEKPTVPKEKMEKACTVEHSSVVTQNLAATEETIETPASEQVSTQEQASGEILEMGGAIEEEKKKPDDEQASIGEHPPGDMLEVTDATEQAILVDEGVKEIAKHGATGPSGQKNKWPSLKVLGRPFAPMVKLGKQALSTPKAIGRNSAKTDPANQAPAAMSTCKDNSQQVSSDSGPTQFLSDVSIPQGKLVGKLNENFKEVESILLNDKGSKFIWICGADNGVGKTTLARRLFDKSPKLLKVFDGRAWASIGKEFQARDVADYILLQLSYSAIRAKDVQAMATTEMMERLEQVQRGRRCLMVFDDVPSIEAWKTIQSALPLHEDTRLVIAACLKEKDLDKLKKFPNTTVISGESLQMEPTWELFENQLSEEDQSTAKEEKWKGQLDKLKVKIFSRCKGVQLATIILGGMVRGRLETLLAQETGELHGWLDKTTPAEGDKDLQELLSLCYKELPYLLKSCFLYMGLFGDDEDILAEKLYLIWIGEGVILKREGETRMVTAEAYLKALAQRGLVMLQEEDTAGLLKVKSCKLHPLVHKLCMLEGQKDGFIRLEKQAKGDQEKLQTKFKISVYVERLHSILKNEEDKHIRSLLFFGPKGYSGETGDLLKHFELVKLLHFDRVDFPSRIFPKGIDRLFHLRHLSFRGCNLKEFPSSFSMLSFLETLDLVVKNTSTVIVPNDLGELSLLLHLYLPLSFKTNSGKLELNNLTQLETLENFDAAQCKVSDLEFLKNLRIFKGTAADDDDTGVKDMVTYVNQNGDLCNSAVSLNFFDFDVNTTPVSITTLMSTDSLQALEIEGHLGCIPTVNWNIDSACITKIVFNGSEFEEDPMKFLGQFHHLRDLILCNDAYLGTVMNCSEGSFPKLQSLELSILWCLEKLNVESGALPCISRLVIEHCSTFKIGRSDLKKLPTLREIMIDVEIRD